MPAAKFIDGVLEGQTKDLMPSTRHYTDFVESKAAYVPGKALFDVHFYKLSGFDADGVRIFRLSDIIPGDKYYQNFKYDRQFMSVRDLIANNLSKIDQDAMVFYEVSTYGVVTIRIELLDNETR